MTKRELWIQIGQEALSEVDRLLNPKAAANFKREMRKVLAAVRKDQASASIIEKLLEELPKTRNWTKVRIAALNTRLLKRRREVPKRPPVRSRPLPATVLRRSVEELVEELHRSVEGLRRNVEELSVSEVRRRRVGGEAKKEAFATMRVFFGTDRKPTGDKKPDKFFAAERGLQLSFGTVDVSIPHDHRVGRLEGPSWWRLEFRKNPSKHILLLTLEALGPRKFVQSLRRNLRQKASREALLFVHGYNVSFEDACRRTAQIAYDLNFQGAPITYSWPSEGKTGRYFVDETNVHWSVPHFRDFLSLVLSETGVEAVHVVAHSMGNRALIEALRTFDLSQLPDSCARLTQVIFAAPDIDAATFQEVAEEFRQKATRFTLYASSKDVALKASKAFHKYARAGDSGKDLVLLDGLDTIDATKVDTGLVGHSYIGDNDSILADVYDLLRGSPPPKRFRLRRKERSGREYWMFQA